MGRGLTVEQKSPCSFLIFKFSNEQDALFLNSISKVVYRFFYQYFELDNSEIEDRLPIRKAARKIERRKRCLSPAEIMYSYTKNANRKNVISFSKV